jgi:uncharacterized membrane protein YhaH (DUF805 family)
MSFAHSIATCLSKYAEFRGRSSRPEFWWFYLFTVLLSWGGAVVDTSGSANTFINIGLMMPSLAAATRRLHDTDRSGWWLLMLFTVVGVIPLIFWLASKGSGGNNRFGDLPAA